MSTTLHLSSGMLRRLAGPIYRAARSAYQEVRLSSVDSSASWRHLHDGFWMYIDPADPMDRAFYFGTYASELKWLIRRLVRPGDLCIDIGAQKGYVTLCLSDAVGPTGKVIAIEPDARAMEILEKNIARNGLHNVYPRACGLADVNGECDFVLSKQLGWSSRFPNELARRAVDQTVKIALRKLDDVVASTTGREELSFIKLDAEGSEPLIIAGAARTLTTHQPVVFFEVNRLSLRAANLPVSQLEEHFRSLGFNLYRPQFNRRLSPRPALRLMSIGCLSDEVQGIVDIIAIHKDKQSRIMAALA